MDTDRAKKLIDSIYKTGMDGAGWHHVLNTMADTLHAEGAWIAFAQPDLQRYKIVAPRSNPDVIESYQQHWWKYDLTTAITSTAQVAQITSLADTGRERFLRSRFYNEFWKHSGQPAERIAVNLFVQGASRISLGIQPKINKEELDVRLVKGVKAFLPHLSRAAEIHCAMRRLELAREVAKTASREKAVLVDRDLQVIFADEDTSLFLARHESIRLSKGHLNFSSPHMQLKLLKLVSSCDSGSMNHKRGGAMVIHDESGKPSLKIDVLPFYLANISVWGELPIIPDDPRLLVFSDLAQNRTEAIILLGELFQLTRAEANVAIELLRGDRRSDVADRLGIKLSTVRTHMMHVFEKVGVTSRAELIKEMTQAGVKQTTCI